MLTVFLTGNIDSMCVLGKPRQTDSCQTHHTVQWRLDRWHPQVVDILIRFRYQESKQRYLIAVKIVHHLSMEFSVH